jgi:hypothetical protein
MKEFYFRHIAERKGVNVLHRFLHDAPDEILKSEKKALYEIYYR